MSNSISHDDAVSRLGAQSDAVGRLAQDSGGFAAVVAAFESNDPDAFRWVLQRLEMLPQCELICEWIRVKLCVLRCAEVCGPRDPKVAVPEPPQFARAVIQLASNEALLRRVVDAVACGDAASYQGAIAEAKLQNFCELLCRYICSTIYRRICEVVCTPQSVPPRVADAALEIRADAEVWARVFANENLAGVISKAAIALDCDPLRLAIGQAGFIGDCEIICRLICVWRCVWVCRTFCVEPPPILAGTFAIDEARKFALAAQPLAGQPRALADLVAAIVNNNAQAYQAIIDRFGLGPYCWQVCGWVCSEVCFEFCICVCPPPNTQPLFTYIGHFDIYTDIDPASGKTNRGRVFPGLYYNGGPNFAFHEQLQLAGYCPIYSPTFPGVQMKYRFLYSVGGGPQAPITGNLVSSVQVGTQAISWPTQSGTNKAVLPMLTLHLPVIVWGPTPAQPTLPPNPVAPAIGADYVAPDSFYIQPDLNGWVPVDPNVDGTGFNILMGFDTTQVTPGPDPAPGVPAGTAVPAPAQRVGTDVSLTFEATRVTTFPPGSTADYNQAPVKILVNNYTEVNELNFVEFGGQGGCCTPINATLSVLYTADHADMDAGAWSLSITSCSPSAPGDITPSSPHTTLAAPIDAVQTSITVASSAGFPATPFTVWLGSTGETMQVTAVAATTWTVTRHFGGTIFNRLTGLDLGDPPSYLIPGNIKHADAPTRYPFLWNAAKQDYTQWPGFAKNGTDILGLARNLGEVYGVFAVFEPKKDFWKLYGVDYLNNNSANFDGLGRLEGLIKQIGPPRWPWAVDIALAEQGSAIYNGPKGGCSGCHGIRPGDIPDTWATPLKDVGTDTKEWDILQWQAQTGVLKDTIIPPGLPLPLRFFGKTDAAFELLSGSVLGSIIQHYVSPPGATAQETQGVNSEPVQRPPTLRELPPAMEDLKDAFHLPGQPSPNGKLTAQTPAPVVPVFEARVLEGIWAAAPYLHNGSVPTLYDLLLPVDQRPKSFKIGPAYDKTKVGLAIEQTKFDYTLNTTDCSGRNSGNSRCGHDYGTQLPPEEKKALLEYLKTL